MSADDPWRDADQVNASLRQLARTIPSFSRPRRSFFRFAERERNCSDADVLTISAATSLVRLFSVAASGLPPTGHSSSTELDELAEQLAKLAEDVDNFLIEYHREGPDVRHSEAFKWRKDAHEKDKVALERRMADVKMDFEDYIAISVKPDIKSPRPRASSSLDSITPDVFDPSLPSMTGTVIVGKARKIKLVGSPMVGSSHTVWRVEQMATGAKLAAKFYKDKEMFKREWDMLKAINGNRNIVSFKIVLEDDSKSFWSPYNIIVMDFCEITLEEMWNESRDTRDMNYARVVLSDIINALEYSHKKGIVHCDIKPSNVMLHLPNIKDQRWIVLDFDSARRVGEETSTNTIEFTAPELAWAKSNGTAAYATPALDVWGLGRIIYFMATPSPFFLGAASDDEIVQRLVQGNEATWIGDDVLDRRTLPEVRALLSKDPSKRKRLDVFKMASFMTNTHSTQELRGVAAATRGDLKDTIINVQRNLSVKMDENTAKIMNELNNVRNMILSMEARQMPRIFALMPATKEQDFLKRSFKTIKSFGREEQMVTFFCEGDVTHRAPHPGYKITKPNEFIRKYGGIIAIGLKLLKFALQVSPLPDIIPAGLPDLIIVSRDQIAGKIIEYTNAVVDGALAANLAALEEDTKSDLARSIGNDSRAVVLDEGMQKAFLDEFIRREDKTMRMANLRRCSSRKDGRILWLCNTCVARMDVAVDEETGAANDIQAQVRGMDLGNGSSAMREVPT